MSILDTFVTVFTADTKKLDDGLEHSRQSADDLVDQLKDVDKAADQAGTGLREAGGGFVEYAKTALGALAGIWAADGLVGSVIERAQEIDAIARSAEALGMTVEDVDAFGRAMQNMGLDAEGARDSLVDMAEAIGEGLQDAEGSKGQAFASLGVNLKDSAGKAIDAQEGLLRLADAAQKLSKEEAVFRIKEVGITDNRVVEAVLKGRQELERLLAVQKAQGTITKENAEQARAFLEVYNRLKTGISSAGMSIANDLMPYLQPLFTALAEGVEWMVAHKDVVKGFFIGVAAAVTAVYLPAMVRAAAATVAATWPFLLIAAAVAAVGTAFALIYDDIKNFQEGNASMIGELLQKYPVLQDIANRVAEGIKAAGQGLQDFATWASDSLAPLGELFSALGELLLSFLGLLGDAGVKIWGFIKDDALAAFQALGDGVVAVFNLIMETIKGVIGFIGNGIGQIAGGVRSAADWVRGAAGKLGLSDETAGAVQEGQRQLDSAGASPLNSVTSNSISNSASSSKKETNLSIGELNVHTKATDAQGMAKGAGGALREQLSSLDSEFATGVDR